MRIRILSILTVALALVVASALAIQQLTNVDIKGIDGKVLITLNVSSNYKVFLKSKTLKVVLLNTYMALDDTQASVNSGPVESVEFSQDGVNTVMLVHLNYSSPDYYLDQKAGNTYLVLKFPSLPEPKGPSTVHKEDHVKKHIVLKGSPKKVEVTQEETTTQPAPQPKPTVKVNPTPKNTNQNIIAKYAPKHKKVMKVKVVSNKVSLELADANIVDVIRLIGHKLNWNLVIDPKVEGTVTLKLKDVDAELALKVILATQGYSYKKIQNIVFVGPTDKVESLQIEEMKDLGPTKVQVIPLENAQAKNIEPIIKSTYPKVEVQADEATNSLIIKAPVKLIPEIKDLVSQLDVPPPPPPPVTPPVTEVIYLNYANAGDVQKMLGGLVPQDAVQVDERLNALVVTAAPDVIDMVKNFVQTVDVPDPQVKLQMVILDLTESATKKLGIKWSRAASFDVQETDNAGNTTFSDWGIHWFTRTGFQLTENMLSFLADRDNATVLARPYVATLNHQKAEIHIGDRIPIVYYDARAGMYQAQYTEVGIVLTVTPEISHNDYVKMQVHAEVSEPTQFIQQYPQIQERKADIIVRVKNNNTVLIGGLLNEKVARNFSKFPLLGDIPILGELFKYRERVKQRTELVVALTPTILRELPEIEKDETAQKIIKRHKENWNSRY